MSKATACLMPRRRDSWLAAITPLTGPDSIVLIGCLRAVAGAMTPPLDCMMDIRPPKPAAARALSSSAMYSLTRGPT